MKDRLNEEIQTNDIISVIRDNGMQFGIVKHSYHDNVNYVLLDDISKKNLIKIRNEIKKELKQRNYIGYGLVNKYHKGMYHTHCRTPEKMLIVFKA